MRNCDSILELAKELGVHRSVLYQWRDQLAPLDRLEWREAEETGESPLERENRRLKQVLADKTLEVDFFRVPCKKSRLGAGATRNLAKRHLRRDPGVDVDAGQVKYRANVSAGMCQPGGLLSLAAGTGTGRRGYGGAADDPDDRYRAQTALRVSAYQRGTAPARDAGKSQAGGAADA
jgi:hypothetical protein